MRSQHPLRVRIYFDTEFTGLIPNAALVSIGLVASDASGSFYAELVDTFSVNECSEFCREVVLPLLEGGLARKTLKELRIELYAWLAARGPGAQLVCDSDRDITQINALFIDGLPPNCEYMVLSRFNRLRRRLLNFKDRLYRKHGLRHHHSRDDAMLNYLIFG